MEPSIGKCGIRIMKSFDEKEEKLITLFPGKTTFGRRGDILIGTAQQSVAPRHFMIEVEMNSVVLHDFQSTHGTYINYERVNKKELQVGDQIIFGEIEMVVEYISQAFIKFLTGNHAGEKFFLRSERNIIGRVSHKRHDVEVRITDHHLSEVHAFIEFNNEKEQFTLMDTGSCNGTYIKDIRCDIGKRYPIVDGDIIKFATTLCCFATCKNKL